MKKLILCLILFISVNASETKKINYENSNKVKFEIFNGSKQMNAKINKYYKSGKLEYTEQFKNGKRDGLKIYFYENGSTKYKVPFVNGKIRGYIKAYQEDGKLKFTSSLFDDKYDGYTKTYFDDGKVNITYFYKDGELLN